jgi:lipopolysaccharide transport system permease protein
MTGPPGTASSPPAPGPLARVIIEPRGGAVEWLELWRFRDLFVILADRDIRLRYRQTALGVVWVILQPLAASLIFVAIFGLFARLPSDGVPYLLFVFAAMLPWNLFAGGVQRAGDSLITDARLITKIYFPRAIIPIASVSAVLLDFVVASAVMLALMLIFGTSVSWAIVAVPGLIVVAVAITVGMSLLFSALNVYYRDFSYALPFVLQVWMYASPVVYSSSLVPEEWQLLYGLNPLVGVIDGFRWALLGASPPTVTLLESAVIACVMLAVGAGVFKRVERSFADVI